MDIVHSAIQDYLFARDRQLDFDDRVLRTMEELGDRLGFPIVGPLVGGILYQLAKISKAESIFELGSGFGYSTYWFAKALPEGGVVHHTDTSAENTEQARKYFELGRLSNKVRFHTGDALESLDREGGRYDILFCDIDKARYPEVHPRARTHLKTGGLLIVDNMLWFGRVTKPKDNTPETCGVKKLTALLYDDKDFFTTLIPIRDGVTVSYRIR